MNTLRRQGQDQLIPFLWIRRSIGFLGFLFPLILIVGAKLFNKDCPLILSSISDYYHTNMRDVFSVVLGLLAFSLFTYRGPDKEDSIASTLAAACAMGIIFFSTTTVNKNICIACDVKQNQTMHLLFATLLFLILAYFALKLFPKTKEHETPTPEKLKRNTLYKTCGYIMLACIVIIAVYMLWLQDRGILANVPVVFILEWIALWAFGISWIVKGEWFILKDKK
jgi:peptidoglycan/LPS O-acetylase OafA/YrhL